MRVIDADGHVLERDIPWADLLEAPYRDRAPKAGRSSVPRHTEIIVNLPRKICKYLGIPFTR